MLWVFMLRLQLIVYVCLQANLPVYHKLDPTKFLRQLLAGKLVLEYPTLVVVLPHELDSYKVIDDNMSAAQAAAAEVGHERQ